MTASAEITALERLSTATWQTDGGYIYSREFTQQAARQIRADLGEYAVVALGIVLTEGDRKIMMKRSSAQSIFGMEQLPLNIKQRASLYDRQSISNRHQWWPLVRYQACGRAARDPPRAEPPEARIALVASVKEQLPEVGHSESG